MSLYGHLLPGSFFIIFGVWWSFMTTIRYIQSSMQSPLKNKSPNTVGFKSTVTMPCVCLPFKRARRAPIESYLKIALPLIALIIEAYTGLTQYPVRVPTTSTNVVMPSSAGPMPAAHEHHHDHSKREAIAATDVTNATLLHDPNFTIVYITRVNHKNTQHITMYSAFIMGAVVEVLIHYGCGIPRGMDYMCGAVGFFIEAFIFSSHLHGKGELDAFMHKLLVWAISGCVVGGGLEYFNRQNPIFAYARAAFTVLQGTWFFQVGFSVEHPPTRWEDNHEAIMSAAIVFCWHIIVIFSGIMAEIVIMKIAMIRFGLFNWVDMIYIDNLNNMEEESGKYLSLDMNGKATDYSESRFLTVESEDDNELDERIVFDKK